MAQHLKHLAFSNLADTVAEWQLDGIECELRGTQHYDGAQAASWWWQRNYAHKFIDYRYDVVEQRIVKRES